MDQRSIVLYLARKGLSTVAIHGHLRATLGAEVISYSLPTSSLREARLATSNPGATLFELNREPDDCDEAILLAFK
jgi:hypothetical protein